jgi:putative transposase
VIFNANLTLKMSRYINTIKTISSREIQKNFPGVKQLLLKNVFWSDYFIAITGQVTLDVLKKHVENQGTYETDEES